MCGIIGMVSRERFSVNKKLLRALKRLEYRGYDSWGYATDSSVVFKETGGIDSFPDDTDASLAISHTRWATHGGVTEENAHPHFNADKTIFAVHNGIIENYEEMKKKLESEGYEFITETDSEVVSHYFDWKEKQDRTMKEAIFDFLEDIEGTFAILLIKKDDDKMYAIKRDSPLVLGILEDSFMLASDVYAFSDKGNQAIFFDDDEFAEVSSEGYEFYDKDGKNIQKKVTEFEWTREEETKENYPHYMIKEINEEGSVAKRLLQSLETTQVDALKKFSTEIINAKRVVFVSCGTSYHAALVGSSILNKIGIRSQAVIASEFENFIDVDKDTVVIAISQSGETMDVVVVLKEAVKKGAKVLSIVNVPYSTIQRYSEVSLETMAGQEICVAATKSFTNQLITLFAVCKELGYDSIDLKKIPRRIKKTIHDSEKEVKKLAKELKDRNDIFVLGRGVSYPIAREIALKLKEIPYIHAEGMMAGELKHGTIALVEEGTPIISLVPNGNPDMISSTKEVQARGARTIIISNESEGDIMVPKADDAEYAIYSSIIGHLLSYYIAKLRELPIDKPRNLAKSVTVK